MNRGIFNKISGNVLVLINLWRQRQIPYLPEEKLWTLRDARLRKIVRYVAETVPYYQNLFQTEKIDPREIMSVKDLDHLPLIDREMVRKDPTQFVSLSRKGIRGVPFITSGTTGSPLTIWHDLFIQGCRPTGQWGVES